MIQAPNISACFCPCPMVRVGTLQNSKLSRTTYVIRGSPHARWNSLPFDQLFLFVTFAKSTCFFRYLDNTVQCYWYKCTPCKNRAKTNHTRLFRVPFCTCAIVFDHISTWKNLLKTTYGTNLFFVSLNFYMSRVMILSVLSPHGHDLVSVVTTWCIPRFFEHDFFSVVSNKCHVPRSCVSWTWCHSP